FSLTFHIILYHCQELPPGSRRYLLRKASVFDHPTDVQVLTAEYTASVYNPATQFMLEIFPLVCNFPVLRSYFLFGFLPVFRAGVGFLVILLSGQGFLQATHTLFMDTDPPWVRYLF